MKRILSLALAALLLVGILAGCGQKAPAEVEPDDTPQIQEPDQPKEPAPEPEDTGEPVAGIGPDMLLLPTMENMSDKWPGSWDNYGLIGRMMIFSRLLRLDSDLNPVYGDLAKEWTVSDDGMQYTFTLNEDVKWHDGEDFSADDVAFSIKTALKAAQVNGVIKGALSNIKGAKEYIEDESKTAADELEGIKIDGNVITIDMAKPTGTFLLAAAQFNIFPRHKIEGLDPLTLNTSEFYDWPIGTGPYKITEFVPNDYAMVEAFDDYFGAKPKIKKVKFTQMDQSDYATRALADEIDFFHINDLATAQAALKNPNYEAFYTDIYFVRYFQWNSKGPKGEGNDPFKDIRTRRAFGHAINRQEIIDNLMPGQAALTNSKVPAAMPYYNPDVYDLKYDPELAKQLLEEANFDFDQTVKLACYYADQGSADFMDAIVAYLGEIGVKAEWTLLTGDLTSQIWDVRDYHFIYAGLSAMAVEEAYNLWYSPDLPGSMYGKIYPSDFTGLDELLEKLWVTTDIDERYQIIKDIQKVETEEMLWNIPMFALRNIQVINTARVNLPDELVLSNEWSNYERYLDKWTINAAE
ncbi:MAG: ABC transporter substrate-binding protein [Clostridiales bacterium]|nr:ABC transporter substrate-binding protein [Clostridiales bacterium]